MDIVGHLDCRKLIIELGLFKQTILRQFYHS